MQELKQSTTVTVNVGPFVDKDDGVVEETGLSPTVQISKNGGTFANRNSATSITHDADGWYKVELDATDTNTLGRLVLKVQDEATHLPVWKEFMIVSGNYYDTKYGSDMFAVNAAQIADEAINNLSFAADAIDAAAFATDAANEIADALLKRDWTSVAGEAPRSVLNALRLLRNKWSIAAGTLTVTEEDDATTAWTSALSDDAGANNVTASDPA